MGGQNYVDFRLNTNKRRDFVKGINEAELDRVTDLKDKLGEIVPKYPDPVPQTYNTFDNWRKYYEKHKPNPYAKKGMVYF